MVFEELMKYLFHIRMWNVFLIISIVILSNNEILVMMLIIVNDRSVYIFLVTSFVISIMNGN